MRRCARRVASRHLQEGKEKKKTTLKKEEGGDREDYFNGRGDHGE